MIGVPLSAVLNGLAIVTCPSCAHEVKLQFPKREAIMDVAPSAALEAGLADLTRTERRLFDLLHSRLGEWVPYEQLAYSLTGDDKWSGGPKTQLHHLKRKLHEQGWEIERFKNTGVRLIKNGVTR